MGNAYLLFLIVGVLLSDIDDVSAEKSMLSFDIILTVVLFHMRSNGAHCPSFFICQHKYSAWSLCENCG